MNRDISYGISVDFLPWSGSGENRFGLSLQSIKIHEEIGGALAQGSAEFIILNENISLNYALKQYTGVIEISKKGGESIVIDIFVVDRRLHKNTLFLDFVCVKDKRFFTDLKSVEYKDISETLSSIFPGKTDIRCESDISNELPLKQFMETDWSFCTKLALSFKKNIVFAYGWDGFMLKDLKDGMNHLGEKEEYDDGKKMILDNIILGGAMAEDLGYLDINYDSMRFVKPWNPWEKSEENNTNYSTYAPRNSKTIKFYDNYLTLGKDYYDLLENYLYNKELLSSKLFASKSIRLNDIPKFRLGDVLSYKHLSNLDVDLPYKTFLVKSNTLHILITNGSKFQTGSGLIWDTELVSLIDTFGQRLPETDVTDKIYEK